MAGEMAPTPVSQAASSDYGLKALFDELDAQGVSTERLLRIAAVRSVAGSLTSPQRFAILKAASGLASSPLTALAAGARQRVHHLGVYGFALATSPTFGDALAFGRQHIDLAGALLQAVFRREADTGILTSLNPPALGRYLPFVAEFWRSSLVTLLTEILGAPFPVRKMTFPYPAPRHAGAYRDYFDCAIDFESEAMELHFDARVLACPCPNASEVTASICQDFCEAVIGGGAGETALQRELRSFILANTSRRCTAEEAATAVGLSKRTLFRRLREEDTSFQALLNETRTALACQYLENTRLPVSDIAERCGFGDESNFRKAFATWRGASPSQWRIMRKAADSS
ncbi:MAG: AraC family transcriptional regulator ligand-binding domain-containing protein [Pseudomonadales bacterium]|nr:AraC family transcriptional regulator ligand-binding domain-containing protein [Pseudomonadales bacterium]MCP5185703.1 AraC family transcriptional regulator ligand-binding domain-containing protein [Pseudomonadales bacterium]